MSDTDKSFFKAIILMCYNQPDTKRIKMTDNQKKELFEEYLKPSWKKTRFWIYIGFTILVLTTLFIVKKKFIDESISEVELKRSVKFFDITSKWIEKEKIQDENFKGIVMVPQISFRVKNIGKRKLKYISFLAVFRALYEGRSMGEGFITSFKKPLNPGKQSKKIVLNSNSGYRTPSKTVFKKMSKIWGKTVVEIYSRSSNSKLTFIKSFFIRQLVEGTSTEVKMK